MDNLELVWGQGGDDKGSGLSKSVYDDIFHPAKLSGNSDKNRTNEEFAPSAVSDKGTAVSDKGPTGSDGPMTDEQYGDMAYSIKNDRAIVANLKSQLDKGFADGKLDLEKLKTALGKYELELELKPLEKGLQLNISSGGELIDSEVSKTPDARRRSVEERYKDKLNDPEVKKFVDQYKDALKSKVVSPEMLDSLRNFGTKAQGDERLTKMIGELGKVYGIDFKFDKSSVTMSRDWPVPHDHSHAHNRVDVKIALDGSKTVATRDTYGPYIGKDNKREISLDAAAKALFAEPQKEDDALQYFRLPR